MKIFSPEFADGETLPRKYTGDGDDVSPPIAWSNPPPGCVEYALMVLDPDAPGDKPFVHWLAYGIPAHVHALPATVPMAAELSEPAVFNQGLNSFGRVGYNGPLPPEGDDPHHYIFKLFALDKKLALQGDESEDELLRAMDRHVLASDAMTVLYQR